MRTKRLMLRVGCGLGWGLVVCLGLVTHLGAEQAAPRRPDRLELAERSEFQPIDAEAVARRRGELARRIAELDKYLEGADSATTEAWKKYLLWPELEQILEGDPLQLPPNAERVAARFYTGQPGLEYPKFVAVREALSSYAALASAHGQQPFDEQFAAQHAGLIDELRAYQQRPTSDARLALMDRLAWFENVGQLDRLDAALREDHRYPNVTMRVSQRFVSEAAARDVHESQFVRDIILGTHVRGTATTVGRVTAELMPDRSRAAVRLVLHGHATTPSLGHQRPVEIRSTSRTSIVAWQPIYLDAAGATMGETAANCDTRTNIHSIASQKRMGRKLIEKIAWRRAGQQKPLAEQIASRKAEARVRRSFRGQAEPTVARANQRLGGEVRRPLIQRNLYPQEVRFHTTSSAVHGSARQSHAGQWASPTAPPVLTGSEDLAIQVHETMVVNTAETAIAGYELTDADAAELMQELTGSVPEGLQPSAERDPWSITFALRHPVRVAFEDDLISVSVEGRRFTRGDRVLNEPMRIAARYRAVPGEEGVILQRLGDVEVTMPGREGQRLGVREVAFKTFMEGKWSEIFKPEIRGRGLAFPGQLAHLGRRPVQSIQSRYGWLSLGWH